MNITKTYQRKINKQPITIGFYKTSDEDTTLSFVVLISDASSSDKNNQNNNVKIDQELTHALLELCKKKKVKEADIEFAANGLFHKLETIVGDAPLYTVTLMDDVAYFNKTKKEVYHLIQQQGLKFHDFESIIPNRGYFKGYNILPFFFNKEKIAFKKSDLLYIGTE